MFTNFLLIKKSEEKVKKEYIYSYIFSVIQFSVKKSVLNASV